jgi:hypothetical protein
MRTVRQFLFLLAAAATAAEEKPAPVPERAAPSTEDGIAIAKKEFDAVKSARNAPAQAAAALPSFTTPELQLGGFSSSPRAARVDAAAAAKKKSGNWLVEAMAEKGKANSKKSERDLSLDELEPDNAPDHATNSDKELARSKKHLESGPNPLDRYMASWMTAKDLELLRPLANGERAGGPGESNYQQFSTPGIGPEGNLRIDALGILPQAPPTSGGRHEVRDNPFLPSTAPSMQSPSMLPPPNLPQAAATGPAASTGIAPSVAPPPPKSAVPSFVKPRDDEKYYKQMKRF